MNLSNFVSPKDQIGLNPILIVEREPKPDTDNVQLLFTSLEPQPKDLADRSQSNEKKLVDVDGIDENPANASEDSESLAVAASAWHGGYGRIYPGRFLIQFDCQSFGEIEIKTIEI